MQTITSSNSMVLPWGQPVDDDLSADALEQLFKNLESQEERTLRDSGLVSPPTTSEKPPFGTSLVCYSDSDDNQEEGQLNNSEGSRFRDPVSEEKLQDLGRKTFAESTKRKITWAINLFHDWQIHSHSRAWE